ncbi:MAG: ATP-binding protein [Nanobdellota archaeon]
MLVGKIFGKVTTKEFRFIVEHDITTFDYVQVYHEVYDYVLCQVVELEKQESMTTATCNIIGYKDAKDGRIKKLKIPFEPGSEVFLADNDFISEVVRLEETDKGAFIGHLEGKDIPIHIDLRKLLTKHLAILAKSGSGKSYTVGVLLEEILDKKVPLIVIDPHGEYSSMKYENNRDDEISLMSRFDISPESFSIIEYGDPSISPKARPLQLSNDLSPEELLDILPAKLSSTQTGLFYSAVQHLETCDLDSVLSNLHQEESNAKWNVINVVNQLKKMGLFSPAPTSLHDMVQSGSCSIINLKGVDPHIQDILVYKLAKDLFSARKKNKIPPFFLVIEEAHNYCPERSFGEKKSSSILRNIASEGRKFGLGMAVVSQRPARVDKSVLSQCSTQMIMKVTNPNDIKAISNSVEGLTSSSEKEMQDVPVGTAIVTGVTEVPLFVKIRPRKSLHGGYAVDMLSADQQENQSDISSLQNSEFSTEDDSLIEKVDEFKSQEILPLIKPSLSKKDLKLMSTKPISHIETVLYPAYLLSCKENNTSFSLLVNRVSGTVVIDKDTFQNVSIPPVSSLSSSQLQVLQYIFNNQPVNNQVLKNNVVISPEDPSYADLLEKNLIVLKDGSASLNPSFLFEKLSTVKTFAVIDHKSIYYDEKKEPSYSYENIVELLKPFTTITDHSNCFIVSYEVEYES